jgi:hypothetical protein
MRLYKLPMPKPHPVHNQQPITHYQWLISCVLKHPTVFVVFVVLAVQVPPWLHHSSSFWGWAVLSGILSPLGLFNHSPSQRFSCAALTALGMSLDFLLTDPEMLLVHCSEHGTQNPLLMHLLVYPATASAMLFSLIMGTKIPFTSGGMAKVFGVLLCQFPLMLLSMWASMLAFERSAVVLNWPWTTNALVAAMLSGMFGYVALQGLLIRQYRKGYPLLFKQENSIR